MRSNILKITTIALFSASTLFIACQKDEGPEMAPQAQSQGATEENASAGARGPQFLATGSGICGSVFRNVAYAGNTIGINITLNHTSHLYYGPTCYYKYEFRRASDGVLVYTTTDEDESDNFKWTGIAASTTYNVTISALLATDNSVQNFTTVSATTPSVCNNDQD